MRSDVTLQPDGADAFLLDPRSGQYYELNHTGTFVWRLLAGGVSPDDVVARLVASYAVDEPTARAELDRWLDELRANDLLDEPRPKGRLRRWLGR